MRSEDDIFVATDKDGDTLELALGEEEILAVMPPSNGEPQRSVLLSLADEERLLAVLRRRALERIVTAVYRRLESAR
jgi:hypothetical protein